MKNEFIPYEQALALKELGFDELCFGHFVKHYDEIKCILNSDDFDEWWTNNSDNLDVKAPLYQQAFRWFREKYGLISYIHPLALLQDTKKWCYEITNFESSWDEDSNLHTLEDAENACLLELINICKKK